MPNGHTPELGEVGITTGWVYSFKSPMSKSYLIFFSNIIKKGRTNSTNEVISDILRQTSITVMPKEICSRFLRTNRQICAGEIDPVHSSCKVFNFFIFIAGGTQKINLLLKAGGRVVNFGKRHQRKVDNPFFLSSTKS